MAKKSKSKKVKKDNDNKILCLVFVSILLVIALFFILIACKDVIYLTLTNKNPENNFNSEYYEIVRNIALGLFAGIGIIFAVWRTQIANKNTAIENEKLELEKDQIKFNIQSPILSEIWDVVCILKDGIDKYLSPLQTYIEITTLNDDEVKYRLEKDDDFNQRELNLVLAKRGHDRQEEYNNLIDRKKLNKIIISYNDFILAYNKNRIFLLPDFIKKIDSFNAGIREILSKSKNEAMSADYSEKNRKRIEELQEKTNSLYNEIEELIQNTVLSNIKK